MSRRIRLLAIAAIVLAAANAPSSLLVLRAQSGPGPGDGARAGRARYVVRMADLPVSSYDGRVRAMPATRPQAGERIDRDDANVVGYAGYLDAAHDAALARVGGGRKIYDYRYSFNGFTAELSDAQAAALRAMSSVVSVTRDELRKADTSSTPTFLGLDAPGGLWDRTGGLDDAGEDIVVGVIDSGIWPESKSFSDRRDDDWRDRDGRRGRGRDDDAHFKYHHLPRWKGTCETGEAFPRSACNRKLIGARHFNAAWGGDAGLKAARPWEYASPRDYNGHGTHTTSTAAGNHGVVATGPAKVFGRISGMAPRARIAVYKALWSTQDGSEASGFTSDLVAAIDQAVADGVDVINYSVSGTSTNFVDAAEISFLFAADAGVFVSASAGNDGPANFTVAHPSPWITTVAAGTHNRNGIGSVTTGSGTTYNGASLASAVGPRPLILAANAAVTGADPTAARLCFAASDNAGVAVLDPAKVTGKIVVCDRGVTARTNKSLAVRDAGGVGMILVNTSPNSVNADLHFVPSVHLDDVAGAALKTYAAAAGATATINQSSIVYDVPAPFTASFSSRGPLLAGNGDLLKPDVIAPGQDILAAVAPPGNHGLAFNIYSGTSMSAPHVAGLAALLMQLHKRWSPMMIKSALMTTASDVLDGSATSAGVIVREGAGHVAPNSAADPGLVFDSNANDWIAFLCGATTAVAPATCSGLAAQGYSLDPSDMNLASIAVGDLAGAQTVTRRVTNVGYGTATYTPVVTGLAGFNVTVSPSSLTIRPGHTRSFTVTMTRTTAAFDTYAGGRLTWSDGRHHVRMPLLVKPVALAAPAEVFGTGGPINYPVTFGYTGPFTATPRGLIPASTRDGSVTDDPGDNFTPGGPGVVAIPVTITAGTTYARFSLFEDSVTAGSDLDLYLFKGTTLVGVSGSSGSNEEVDLVNPAAGADYVLYVHGFDVATTANFRLFSWLLGTTAAGNMAVTAPPAATTGATGTVTLTFSGLQGQTRYLGSVVYGGSSNLPAPTIVRVDTP